MIKAIQQFFTQSLQSQQTTTNENTLHLAAAALMIELIYIDETIIRAEKIKMVHILEKTWHIPHNQIEELIKLAEKEVDGAHDLFQFTRLINDNYAYDKKCQLVESLWHLAYADDELNKYEEAMIRKISDLLYVQHADFIRAKQKVLAASL